MKRTPGQAVEPRTSGPTTALRWMTRAALAWFLVYLLLQGQDGFFAVTADRIDSAWVSATFLNVPLQLVLTAVAAGCGALGRPVSVRAGLGLAGLCLLLIAGHVALSVATA